ncbi:hypothetical protein CTA1_12383 [Colletotrichum tanaceti]|uniref:Uncharacterized protein n=1 Tax=Colletotrichum tanaceti TaxID=1306861 RepID=A0A4U6XM49_9PEZI|nr:hypothetical protein CTA1_12383 [Colletotrichum tanaceti]
MLAGALCSVLLAALRLATVVQKDHKKQQARGGTQPDALKLADLTGQSGSYSTSRGMFVG